MKAKIYKIKERIMKRYETKRIKIEKLLNPKMNADNK